MSKVNAGGYGRLSVFFVGTDRAGTKESVKVAMETEKSTRKRSQWT